MVHLIVRRAAHHLDDSAELLPADGAEQSTMGAGGMDDTAVCTLGTHHRGAAVHDDGGISVLGRMCVDVARE